MFILKNIFKNIIHNIGVNRSKSNQEVIRRSVGGAKKNIYSKIIKSISNERFSDCVKSEYAFIIDTAKIHDTCTIAPGSYIGDKVEIGKNSRIFPNVTILDNTIIGDNVVICSGTVVGTEGYGFYYDKKLDKIEHVPHIARVIIKNDVFVGANVSISRGSSTDTIIEANSKINNNVHIAHNVTIGKSCLIMAGVSISGSTVIGDNVVINPKAAIAKHLNIGENAEIAMGSTVIRDVPVSTRVMGSPAKPK